MSLIRHLVWHDLRSQRLAMMAWGAFLLVGAALTVFAEGPDGRAYSVPLSAVRVVLLALVTSLVIQQDSLVGTSAFWRTRPIGRGALLTAKAITLGLVLIGLPGVITWLIWWRLGVYAGDAGVIAQGLMLENATIVLLTAMAAVVTPSLTYMVVAGVAGGTMVSVINSVVLPSLLTTWPFVGMALGRNTNVYLGTLFVLGVPAVVYQYLRLKEWHTASMVACALLASTTLARFWPAPPPPALPPVDHRVMDPQAVSLVVSPESLRRTESLMRARGAARDTMAVYEAAVTAQGQPDDVRIGTDTIESRLLLRDRTETWSGRFSGWIPPAYGWRRAEYRALKAALAPAAPPEPQVRQGEVLVGSVPLMSVPVQVDRSYAGQPARLTTDMNLYARRLRVAAAAHPAEGVVLRLPGGAVRILSATADGHRVALKFRTSRVFSADQDYLRGRWPVFQQLYLRNLRTKDAWAPRCARVRPLYTTLELGVSSIMGSTEVMTCMFGPQGSEPAATLDSAWLADAELVALESEMVGGFTRSFQMDLVVGSSSPGAAR